MKKAKKVAALAVAAALAASNTMILTSWADDPLTCKFTASTSAASVQTGDTFMVTVSIDHSSAHLAAFLFDLEFDDSAFEIVSASPVYPEKEEGEDDDDFNDRKDEILAQYKTKYLFPTATVGINTGSIRAMTTDTSSNIRWKDGKPDTVLELEVKVKDDAEPKDYTFAFPDKTTIDLDNFFKNGDDDNFIPVDPTFVNATVTVTAAPVSVSGITVAPTTIDFAKAGDTVTIVPTVLPNNATDKSVKYSSDKTSVATVSDDGVVTAKGEGTCTITVETNDGGYKAEVAVSVAHTHTMETIDAETPTCIKEGNNKYYHCTSCDKYFKDAEGTQATTPDAEKLAKTAHDFSAEKTEAKYLKSAATCVDKAVYYKSCSVCGEKGTETFEYGEVDAHNHVGGTYIKDDKPATCTEAGYTGDTYCSSCNAKIAEGMNIPALDHVASEEWSYDDAKHWKTCTLGCGTILDEAPHSGGEATCIKKAVCEVCGQEYGAIDPNNHKGETELRNAKAPTTTEAGYTGDLYCLDCNQMIQEGEVIPPHEHVLNHVERKEPTHFEDGNIEYWYCADCGLFFADENAETIITEEETVLPKLPHSFGEEWKSDETGHWHECECGAKNDEAEHTFGDWTVVVENEVGKDGLKTRACEICGYEEEEIIPALEPEDSSEPETSEPEDSSEPETSEPEDSSSAAPTDDSSSKPSDTGKQGGGTNPSTGAAASAFAVATVLGLAGLMVAKKRK